MVDLDRQPKWIESHLGDQWGTATKSVGDTMQLAGPRWNKYGN